MADVKRDLAHGTHLKDPAANAEWMRSRYDTVEYWSDDLRYGNRWSKGKPVKDTRHVGIAFERYVMPWTSRLIQSAVEIGPGGGRWTPELLRIAGHVHLVDISAASIEVCRERFKYYDTVTYHVTDGSSLGDIPPESVDLVFSWGVLVHVQSAHIEGYLAHLPKILKPSGRAVIQHGIHGTIIEKVRSDFRIQDMTEMAKKYGLHIKAQMMTGQNEGDYLDCVTVLERAVSEHTI